MVLTRHNPWPIGDDAFDEDWSSSSPSLQAESEERYVIAELYGPDGEVISQWLDRPEVSIFGYCVEKEVSEWRRI